MSYGMNGWNKEIPGGDLISRAAAIGAVNTALFPKINTAKDAEKALRALPSAQPERLTDDDFETVRIHLNAYKERLCNQHRWEEAEEYQRIIDRFMSFASAQPKKRTNKHTETRACDCISRQAAIDAIDAINAEVEDGYGFDYAKWRVHFRVLPSAQPDNSYSDGFADGYKQGRIDAQPEQQWIPCSERLPKEYGNYLITTHNGDVDVGTIDPKKKGVWSACDADGFYWIREVVAWMPLPKPYKEDDHETD